MRFIKHKKWKDICLQVVKITYKGERLVRFKARFWNLGCTGKPWVIFTTPHEEELILEDFKNNWSYIQPDEKRT